MLAFFKALVRLIEALVNTPTPVDHVMVTPMQPTQIVVTNNAPAQKLIVFCLAIQSREGWFGPGKLKGYPSGTPAYINNNPGNCRWPFGKPYPENAIGVDHSEFLIFPNYMDGFNYLMDVTRAVCAATAAHNGAYQTAARTLGLKDCSQLSILQYFTIRDPKGDNNDPLSYATEVATKVGLTVDAKMSEVLA